MREYRSADGLPHDRVERIVRDSRGFLWFCTAEGLGRFDGHGFARLGTEHGLPNPAVNDLLETRAGAYWVATNGGGVARFEPPSAAASGAEGAALRFTVFDVGDSPATNHVNVLFEDRGGRIWAGTDAGLFVLGATAAGERFEAVGLPGPLRGATQPAVLAFAEDAEGGLWIGTTYGVRRRLPDGSLTAQAVSPAADGTDTVSALLADESGRLWVGHNSGVLVAKPAGAPPPNGSAAGECWHVRAGSRGGFGNQRAADLPLLPTRLGEAVWVTGPAEGPRNATTALLEGSDGRVWIGTTGGLAEFDGTRLRRYTRAYGLSDEYIFSLAEDSDGNLWVGSRAGGAMRLARNGLVAYPVAEGMSFITMNAVFEDEAGDLYAINRLSQLMRFDGEGFVSVGFNLPVSAVLRDRAGEWWVGTTTQGLYRFPRVARFTDLRSRRPLAHFSAKNGLGSDRVEVLFEDSRGDVWVSTVGGRDTLHRWGRAGETFRRYTEEDGLPSSNAVRTIAEDAAGGIWVGLRENGMLLHEAGGKFARVALAGEATQGAVRSVHRDARGRLWAASTTVGLTRFDRATDTGPQPYTSTVAEGLSSHITLCLAEDAWGRIYVGTVRGVDRLEPETGRVKRYTTADGLVGGETIGAFRDGHGALWFISLLGLSRLMPAPDRPAPPPPVYIGGLRVAGADRTVPPLGATALPGLTLGPREDQIQIDFFGLGFESGAPLRYQHRLNDGDWSRPSEVRTVDLAHLAPGSYRFAVRAVNSAGVASAEPATFAFTVLPPVWRRPWFLALAAALVTLLVVALDRYRVARMKRLAAALAESERLTTELTEQRGRLSRATHALELEAAVTRVLAEAATPADAEAGILRVICEMNGWETGAVWHVDEAAGVLRCGEVWRLPEVAAGEFERLTRRSTFAPGVGLPGRVWESRQPLWIADVGGDADLPRSAAAATESLRSAFGFPVLLGSEVIGVLEFFGRAARERDEQLLGMLPPIGAQTGQLIERKRAEGALRESETRFRTLAETASDAIITIDEGSIIIFVNAAAEKVFGYSADELVGADLTMLMPEYLRHLHRAGLGRYVETSRRHISWEAVELPGLHKSGRELPLEISFGEFQRNGRRYFTGIARDVTERKHAEEALRRSREERLAELERVRKRIATDLHDDVGSSLTRISLLSEVARRQADGAQAALLGPLSSIAGLSRELVDSMGDIVWAINPDKDHLSDLSQRMRRFASDVFTARGIDLRFHAPDSEREVTVGANVRREIFLVFKEAVNNAVRHSGCSAAEVEFRAEADGLFLRVSDNGRGLDSAREGAGHGLASIRVRAEALGGRLEVASRAGRGTTLTFTVPLGDQRPPPASAAGGSH